jgi:hypothetical protein
MFWREGDKGMRGIMEKKKRVRNEDMKQISVYRFSIGFLH